MAETGFKHIDLSFYHSIYPGSPWTAPGDGWKREVEDCLRIADKYGFDFWQAHAPTGVHYGDGEERDATILALKRNIEACHMLGIPHTVLHAQEYKPDNTQFVQRNAEFYRLFADTCEKYNVDLLTENSSAKWAPSYLLRTGRELREFVDAADNPHLFICWDTGHGNCEGLNQYDEIMAMGDKLHAVHMQDNFGECDLHMTPMLGTTNFDRVMSGLRDVGFKGTFTFEDDATIRRNGTWPVARPFVQEGDKLIMPPVSVAQKMMAVSYEIGKWMIESYGMKAD